MQKVWKKIAALAVLLCLTLACAVLAACDGTGNSGSKTKYTLKVVLPNYDSVAGVEITFTDAETGKANAPIVTNEEGIATAEYPEANYRVSVTESTLPDGWGLKAGDKNMTTANWGEGITSYVIELTESTKTYTVSVTLPNGDPAANVGVVFTATGEQPVNAVTGTDGKVSVTLPSDVTYLVTIDETTLPANAAVKTADVNGIVATSGGTVSFALVTPLTYTFEVTGPADADLSGIAVSYAASPESARAILGATDATGKLVISCAPIAGYAFIDAPEGFVYNEYYGNTESNPCPYVITDRTPVRFSLIRHSKIEPALMTEAEKTAYVAATGNTTFANLCGEEDRNIRSFTANLTANELQIVSFRTTEKGNYFIFINSNDATLRTYDSLNLNSYLSELTSKTQSVYLNGEKNRTYYIALQAPVSINVRVAIVEPPETNETEVYETGTYQLTIKEKLPAELKFHPKESGIYTLKIENGSSGYLIETISPATHQPILDESSENGTLEMKVLAGEITPNFSVYRWLRFSSSAAAPAYPIEITVTVEKTGELVEQTVIVTDAPVTERLTQYGAQQGELTQLGVDGTNDRIVKGADGLYHLDSEEGPVVVIKLKGTIDVFYPDTDFENLDENSAEYTIYISSDTLHIYYINYAKFLRGYNYGDKDNTGAYASEYYLKYVNEDGVYPLTDELKTFLERMAAKNQNWLIGSANGYSADSLWLFSAYFYNDGTYTPPDPPIAPAPITGNGTLEDPYLLAFAEGENTLESKVSIDVTTSEQTGNDTPETLFFRFTPSESGYYVLKLLHRDAQFIHWDGTYFRGSRTDDKQFAYYGTALEAGEPLEFSLTCTAQSRYPLTYSYQIYETDPPAPGSADSPVMVETQSYTVNLKAGERYFFGIDMNEGYRINFTSDSVRLYDFGSSVTNDDRIKTDYLLEDNSEITGRPSTLFDTYIAVIADEDCSVTITFTQIS